MIRLENVTKTYKGGVDAVVDVSFEVNRGEFVFLVGPSGSGKTTLMRLLLREEVPSTGRLWVGGKDVISLSKGRVPHFRRNIGCVFQDFRLLPTKTAAENVAFALQVIGRPRHVIAEQVAQVLDLVGLQGKGNRMPTELSGGEQQRVAVARAFVNRPLLMLSDEPTGNLDPETSKEIMRLFERINKSGTTVVMATHDAELVDAMRRRVIALSGGKLVRDELRGSYAEADSEPEMITKRAWLHKRGSDRRF